METHVPMSNKLPVTSRIQTSWNSIMFLFDFHDNQFLLSVSLHVQFLFLLLF